MNPSSISPFDEPETTDAGMMDHNFIPNRPCVCRNICPRCGGYINQAEWWFRNPVITCNSSCSNATKQHTPHERPTQAGTIDFSNPSALGTSS